MWDSKISARTSKKMAITVSRIEKQVTAACLALGLGLAAFLAKGDDYFFPNFAFYWGTQIFVLPLALLFRPRPAIVAGIGFSMALYLAMFHGWVFSDPSPDSMAWLFYWFSLPGAAAATLLGTVTAKETGLNPLAAGASAAAFVALGIVLNLAIVFAYVS
ncbi:MAG: hypothetical protein ACH34Y_02555 [Brachymonas sp.]